MRRVNASLEQAIPAYIEYLQHEQGASLSTRLGYQSWLRRFRRYVLSQTEREPLLSDITTEDIRGYLYSLSRQGLRPRTLRSALYPLRGLFGLAVARGDRPDNPALAIRLPKKDAARRATVSDEELAQLLHGCEREPDPERRGMSTAILSLFTYAGLRRQELLDLQLADIDLSEGQVLVRSGKGAKSRSLYVCSACVEALRDWLAVRPRTAHVYLFTTDCRRRLGEAGLAQLLGRVKSMADLRDHNNITPHAIRHAAATRLLRHGADLRSIQQFLGHSQLQTTAIYLHTDERQLQKIAGLAALSAPQKTDDPTASRSTPDPKTGNPPSMRSTASVHRPLRKQRQGGERGR